MGGFSSNSNNVIELIYTDLSCLYKMFLNIIQKTIALVSGAEGLGELVQLR